jgi:hypothetical protein
LVTNHSKLSFKQDFQVIAWIGIGIVTIVTSVPSVYSLICIQVPSVSPAQNSDPPQQQQQQQQQSQQQQPQPPPPPEQESGWSQVLNSNPELRAVVNACER